MSIPKEPRQLMINLMYLVLTALLALNVSAEILNAFNLVNKGIGNTNTILQDKNNQIVAGIAGKADEGDDPRAGRKGDRDDAIDLGHRPGAL